MLDKLKDLGKMLEDANPYVKYRSDYDYDEADGEIFPQTPLTRFIETPLGQLLEDIKISIDLMDPYRVHNYNYDYDGADGEIFPADPIERLKNTPIGRRVEDLKKNVQENIKKNIPTIPTFNFPSTNPYVTHRDDYDYDEADGEIFPPNLETRFYESEIGQKVYKVIDMIDEYNKNPYRVHNPDYDYDGADGEIFPASPLQRMIETNPMGGVIQDILDFLLDFGKKNEKRGNYSYSMKNPIDNLDDTKILSDTRQPNMPLDGKNPVNTVENFSPNISINLTSTDAKDKKEYEKIAQFINQSLFEAYKNRKNIIT